MTKKSILSSICAASFLLGTSPAHGMWRAAKFAGKLGALWTAKKYVYDPIKTQIKFRKYLAPKKYQDFSSEILDCHLKVHGGGIRKKLLVKYLKAFGYNKVYFIDPKDVHYYHLLPIADKIPRIKKTLKPALGLAGKKGGIFMHPKIKKLTFEEQEALISHEDCHHYKGETTDFSKFIILYIAYLSAKKIESCRLSYQKEYDTCKKNVKTLFYSKNFKPFLWAVESTTKQKKAPLPYVHGRSKGFEEISRENPNHPIILGINKKRSCEKKFDYAFKNGSVDVETRKKSLKDFKKARDKLSSLVDEMETKAPKLEGDF